MSLSEISATEIARQIREGQLSCMDVTEHFISQQKLWNPKINAVVEQHWSEALTEAKNKDLELTKTDKKDLPPFFGVPITVKEMISVQGYRQTAGSIHRRRNIQSQDATVVRRLREAGAIVTGTTNVPELGFWFECDNPVYGRTFNPFDVSRTSGGSSGGEAAMIAAGGSPLGVGSDVGGSIRMPAGFCGIFGHKPSNRIVPITGHYLADPDVLPNLKDPHYPLTAMGPLARKSEDLITALQLMIGADGIDPEVKNDFKLGAMIEDWSDVTVWILPEPKMTGVGRTEPEMAEAVRITGSYFEGLGARVREMKADVLKNATFMWSAGLSDVEGRSFEEILFNSTKTNLPVEVFRSLFGVPQYTVPALVTVLTERLINSTENRWEDVNLRRKNELREMRQKLNQLLTGHHILVLPVHPRSAPKHNATLLRPFDFAMTAVFNALGNPVTTAPVSWENEIPQSVQIVSAWGQDHLTLSAAKAIEFAFGGSRRPSLPS